MRAACGSTSGVCPAARSTRAATRSRLDPAQKHLPWALALLLTTDTATTARQLEARIKRLTRAQKDALIADPARLPALCPALAGADIRPVPDAQLTDYLPDTEKPADA